MINTCGLMNIPKGTKYGSGGIGLKVHYDNSELSLRLVHNANCIVQNGNKLVTSTEKISLPASINISHFSIYSTSKLSTTGPVQISIKNLNTKELLAFIIIDQKTAIESIVLKPDCAVLQYNLNNTKLLVEIESVCSLDDQCCKVPNFTLSPSSRTVEILCPTTTTTTTTTTVDPSACKDCESVSLTISENPSLPFSPYKPRVKLLLQNRSDTSSIATDVFLETWYINDLFTEGSLFNYDIYMPEEKFRIAYWIFENPLFTPEQTFLRRDIEVYVQCVNGIYLLEIESYFEKRTINQILGRVTHKWYDIELPMNNHGLPFGSIVLPSPTIILLPGGQNDGLEPVIPNIVFEYLPYDDTNPVYLCSKYITTTTTPNP